MHNRKQPRAENTWCEVDTQRRENTDTKKKKGWRGKDNKAWENRMLCMSAKIERYQQEEGGYGQYGQNRQGVNQENEKGWNGMVCVVHLQKRRYQQGKDVRLGWRLHVELSCASNCASEEKGRGMDT